MDCKHEITFYEYAKAYCCLFHYKPKCRICGKKTKLIDISDFTDDLLFLFCFVSYRIIRDICKVPVLQYIIMVFVALILLSTHCWLSYKSKKFMFENDDE